MTVQDQILSILAKLQRDERAGVVYVTHDLAVVAQLCQEVAVMYAGRVAEVGRVADVFDVPRHPYTLGLLRSVPRFERTQRRLSSIAGVLPDVFHPPTGCRFHPRCQFAEDDCRSGEFPLIAVADRPHDLVHPLRPLPRGGARGAGDGRCLNHSSRSSA